MTPERYANVKWGDVPENIKGAFIENASQGKGIYLFGEVGSGKTHIAYALKNRWEQNREQAIFWNVTELIHELKLDMDRREKSFIGEQVLRSTKLLILDDIGAERVTDWVAETLYLIVNKRYNSVLPTIFTSNLPIGELGQKVGDRVASRIVEMCEIINLQGGDRRLKK